MARFATIMAQLVIFLLSTFTITQESLAQNSPTWIESQQKKTIDEFIITYNASIDITDFMEHEKAALPTEDYRFVRAQLANAHLGKRPTITRNGDFKFILKIDGKLITYELIPGAPNLVRINNHTLDFSTAHTASERWDLVSSAIPKESFVSLISLFVPTANAIPWGAIKSVASGGAAGVIISTAIGMAFGFIGTKDQQCSALKQAYTDCRKILASLRSNKCKKWLSKEVLHQEALENATAQEKQAVADAKKAKKKNTKSHPKKNPKAADSKKGDDSEDDSDDEKKFDPLTYDITEQDGYDDLRDSYIDALGGIDDLSSQTQSWAVGVCKDDPLVLGQRCRSEVSKLAKKLQLDDGLPAEPNQSRKSDKIK